jgi:hypothetical protein
MQLSKPCSNSSKNFNKILNDIRFNICFFLPLFDKIIDSFTEHWENKYNQIIYMKMAQQLDNILMLY